MRISLPAVAIATALLAGCAADRPDKAIVAEAPAASIATVPATGSAPAHTTIKRACPHLTDYPEAEQMAVAAELEAMPEASPVVRWIGDYIALRDQVGAFRKGGAQ